MLIYHMNQRQRQRGIGSGDESTRASPLPPPYG
jgi:hypothetical protein